MTVPRYRELAEKNLGAAARQLNAIPTGDVRADEFVARSAQAQASATVAVAQALLEIGDVLREALSREGDES